MSRVSTIVSPPSRTFYEFIRVEMARLKQSPPSRRTRSDADNSFAQAKCQTKEATRITQIDAGILRDKITRVNSRHSRITFPPAFGAHEPPATAGRHRKGAKLRKEIWSPVRGRNLRSNLERTPNFVFIRVFRGPKKFSTTGKRADGVSFVNVFWHVRRRRPFPVNSVRQNGNSLVTFSRETRIATK